MVQSGISRGDIRPSYLQDVPHLWPEAFVLDGSQIQKYCSFIRYLELKLQHVRLDSLQEREAQAYYDTNTGISCCCRVAAIYPRSGFWQRLTILCSQRNIGVQDSQSTKSLEARIYSAYAEL